MFLKTRIPPEIARKFLNFRKQGQFVLPQLGTTIYLKQSGVVRLSVPNHGVGEIVESFLQNLSQPVEVGSQFQGIITRVLPFGAFAMITPTQEGLLHISEFAGCKPGDEVSDFVKVGDIVPVRIIEIDRMGRINLSGKLDE